MIAGVYFHVNPSHEVTLMFATIFLIMWGLFCVWRSIVYFFILFHVMKYNEKTLKFWTKLSLVFGIVLLFLGFIFDIFLFIKITREYKPKDKIISALFPNKDMYRYL